MARQAREPASDGSYECRGGLAVCHQCNWWLRGWCPGCDADYQGECLKRRCHRRCHSCSGGTLAHTIGCCGSAPRKRRNQWYELLDTPVSFERYTPKALDIRCHFVPVIHSIRNYNIAAHPDCCQIDTWAVPLSKVASREGRFYSSDLKDYLGLPSGKKLVLSTCVADDYQEMLWREGPLMDYEEHGIDYWFPAHFSIYDRDSRLYQFANARRQQLHALNTQSQFLWYHLCGTIPPDFLKPEHPKCPPPGLLFYTAQMRSQRHREIVQGDVQEACRAFPDSPLFFAGGRRKLEVPDARECFEMSSTWLHRALHRCDISGKRSEEEPEDLLAANLRAALSAVGEGPRKGCFDDD